MTIRRTITTALLAAAAFALAGCAGAATLDAPTSGSATEMTVTGTLTLHQTAGINTMTGANGTKITHPYGTAQFTTSGSYCGGKGGYSDISAGAAVTIYDAAGTIIGAGTLGAGTATTTSTTLGGATATLISECVFPFTVAHVPTGSGFFQYEISHRGRLTFTAAEAPFLAADLNNK